MEVVQLEIRYGLDVGIRERTKSKITSLVRLVEWMKSLVARMKKNGEQR